MVAHYFEAILLSDITAKSCADNFVLHCVVRFDAPDIITTNWAAKLHEHSSRTFPHFKGKIDPLQKLPSCFKKSRRRNAQNA